MTTSPNRASRTCATMTSWNSIRWTQWKPRTRIKPGDRTIACLNAWVALTVAILATFMAMCKVKDDNIVEAMPLAQADEVDRWGYYQARNLREDVAVATMVQLTLSAADHANAQQAAFAAAIATFTALAHDQASKKTIVLAQAENDQAA